MRMDVFCETTGTTPSEVSIRNGKQRKVERKFIAQVSISTKNHWQDGVSRVGVTSSSSHFCLPYSKCKLYTTVNCVSIIEMSALQAQFCHAI